jgi:hypothetical protein
MTVPNSGKRQVTRLKAIAIPVIENKFVVVRDKSGELTFPGGGCAFGSDPRKCAAKELYEETRKTIKKNAGNLIPFYIFTSKLRSNTEKANNNKKSINVTSEYHVFKVPVENFTNIKNNYYSQKLLNNNNKNKKEFMETIGIHLTSLANLKSKKRVYSIVKNNILNKLNDPGFRATPRVSSRRPNGANARNERTQSRRNQTARPYSSRSRW